MWTAFDSTRLKWEREVLDYESGESYGSCKSEHIAAVAVPLVIVMMIPTLLTCLMAWKTKDVSLDYSESHWIFIMIIVQIEVIIFSAPTIVVLRDNPSTNSSYIGYVILLWTFPMSTLCFIFIPKMVALYRSERGMETSSPEGQRRRGEGGHGQVKVSGVAVKDQEPVPRPIIDPGMSTTSRTATDPEKSSTHAG